MHHRRGFCRTPTRLLALLLLVSLAAAAQASQWQSQTVATHASLRGLAVVSNRVVWASGTAGTFLRTLDGGRSWTAGTVSGAAHLDFRDVEALDGQHAWLMSAGPGELSRVYFTSDGGGSWTLQLENHDPSGFFDALAFFDRRHGLILGDPVDGRFEILRTADGGAHWDRIPAQSLPPALPKEGAFAASGTCLVTMGRQDAWFATGGARTARVFHSRDGGETWTAAPAPLRAGSPGAGIFSLAFLNQRQGIAVGGDYLHPAQTQGNAALTADGGQSWQAVPQHPPGGYRSAVAFLPGSHGRVLAATGPTGTDISRDGGLSWQPIGETGYNCIRFAPDGTAWLAGPAGRIARLQLQPAGGVR